MRVQEKGIRPRPLSPHLQIYRMQLTSVLSILHRLTGVILYGGAFIWITFLVMLVTDCACVSSSFLSVFESWIGKTVVFIWVAALYYHLFNGIRHLCWDMGKGFELPTVYRSGWAVVSLTFLFTLLTWIRLM